LWSADPGRKPGWSPRRPRHARAFVTARSLSTDLTSWPRAQVTQQRRPGRVARSREGLSFGSRVSACLLSVGARGEHETDWWARSIAVSARCKQKKELGPHGRHLLVGQMGSARPNRCIVLFFIFFSYFLFFITKFYFKF
jgi:hypothetical protein